MIFTTLVLLSLLNNCFTNDYTNEEEAKKFLKKMDAKLSREQNAATVANWNYETNLTEVNMKTKLVAEAKLEALQLAFHSELKKYDYKKFSDENIRRQFEKLMLIDTAALDPKDSDKFSSIIAEMLSIYSSATIDVRHKRNISLEPHLTEIMANERDYDLLKEVWVNWRDATGKKVRKMFSEYVDIANKIAVQNSYDTIQFRNFGDYWLHEYEDKDFKAKIEKLWIELEPFYKLLHAFVRMKLRKKYGTKMPTDGTIPAHILGNMWAQSWENIFEYITPFPDLPPLDVTTAMKNQGYNPKRMFEMAEEFFVSLGLESMTKEFWNYSMIVKPENRDVVCHATSWDFSTGHDFRIKMCTKVNMENLLTVHHEMGHIEYFMLYKDQPLVFRDGANAGFHEALGDLIALSVSTPKHLQKIGLLDNYSEGNIGVINFQLKMALETVAFLPFGYLIDLWRWDVFSKSISNNEYTRKWWELRLKYQGISPPVPRTENDFDPGAKYHVVAHQSYIRYFVSFVIRFQFHKALCELTGQPELHNCDIYGNKDAGNKIREVFSQGSSTPWQTQLQQFTKSFEMSAHPLIEYFKPLRQFLEKELKDEKVGWTADVNTYSQ